MKSYWRYLAFLILLSCGDDEPSGPTGVTVDDYLAQDADPANVRYFTNFWDKGDLNYGIVTDGIPSSIQVADVELAISNILATWGEVEVGVDSDDRFSFNYLTQDFENSDLIFRVISREQWGRYARELPGVFGFDGCSDFCRISMDVNDCVCSVSNIFGDRYLANAPLPFSLRFPDLIELDDSDNDFHAELIDAGVIDKDFWKYVYIFDDVDWVYGKEPNEISVGQFDLESMLLHEVGHKLGLAHNSNREAVMFKDQVLRSDGTFKRTLHPEDISRLQGIYPDPTTGLFQFGLTVDEEVVDQENSRKGEFRIDLIGDFLPAFMDLQIEGTSAVEFLDLNAYNKELRAFEWNYEDGIPSGRLTAKLYQEEGGPLLKEFSFEVDRQPGFVALRRSDKRVFEIGISTGETTEYDAIDIGAISLSKAGFNSVTFDYTMFQPGSSSSLITYNLITKDVSKVPIDRVFGLTYTNSGDLLGLINGCLVRIDPTNGQYEAVSHAIANGFSIGLGRTVNGKTKTYSFSTAGKLFTVSYENGQIIHEVDFDGGIGLVYSEKNDLYYCIKDGQIQTLDVSTGLFNRISGNADIVIDGGFSTEGLFLHPTDNRYYYIQGNQLIGVNPASQGEKSILQIAEDYSFVLPVY